MRDDAGRGADEDADGTVRSESLGGDSAPDERAENDVPETESDGGEPRSGNVAGEFRPSETIEPESVDLGNALVVVLGAYLAVLGIGWAAAGSQGLGARTLLLLTGVTVFVALVCLGFFGLLTPDT